MNNDSAKIKNILREGITLEPYFLCEHCKEGIVIEENHFCEYFKSDFIKCNNCEKKSDLWLQILELIRTKNLFLIFNAIGAKTGHFSKLFKPGQRQTINFEGYGLPKDGKILFINYLRDTKNA